MFNLLCLRLLSLLENGLVARVRKRVFLSEQIGELDESLLQVGVGLEETDNGDLLLGGELGEVVERLEFLGAGADLRLHVLDEAVAVPGAVVLLGRVEVTSTEDLERGVAGHTVLGTSFLACFGTVHLGQGHRRVVGTQDGRRLFILGLQLFAVTAPSEITF
jgi:hypothetical protein